MAPLADVIEDEDAITTCQVRRVRRSKCRWRGRLVKNGHIESFNGLWSLEQSIDEAAT
jgi:hypothetical protein